MKGRDAAAAVGLGAACAVCCAGPILAFLAAIGVGTALGVATFGVFGSLAVLLVIPVLLRRHRSRCTDPAASVAVDAPTAKAKT